MIPTFNSSADMMDFIRALPEDANYAKMLREEFDVKNNFDIDSERADEYLFKYLVQGTHHGKEKDDLIEYAVEGVNKLMGMLPHLKNKEPVVEDDAEVDDAPAAPAVTKAKTKSATKAGKPRQRQKIAKQPDGTINYAAHRDVWFGWLGGRVAVTTKTKEKAIAALERKFKKEGIKTKIVVQDN